jgi:hypothetical protein
MSRSSVAKSDRDMVSSGGKAGGVLLLLLLLAEGAVGAVGLASATAGA